MTIARRALAVMFVVSFLVVLGGALLHPVETLAGGVPVLVGMRVLWLRERRQA